MVRECRLALSENQSHLKNPNRPDGVVLVNANLFLKAVKQFEIQHLGLDFVFFCFVLF